MGTIFTTKVGLCKNTYKTYNLSQLFLTIFNISILSLINDLLKISQPNSKAPVFIALFVPILVDHDPLCPTCFKACLNNNIGLSVAKNFVNFLKAASQDGVMILS